MAFISGHRLFRGLNFQFFLSRLYSSNLDTLSKTCLHNFHIENGANMVEFAGYSMPLQYKSHSIIDSHNWVRNKCGLFDVSHMLQFRIHGSNRQQFAHRLMVVDMNTLAFNQGSLSLFTNDDGGIMDDLIISNSDENHYYVVSNAGCADKIRRHLITWQDKFQMQGQNVRIEWVNNGLIALQGPLMSEVLQPGLDFPLNDLYFGFGKYCSVFGIPNCRVTRCGYTGEDGVEISVPSKDGQYLAEKLLSNKLVIPVGLGARDTLRLEAGLCLYGNDIDELTTPSEASLTWTIGKKRKNVKEYDIKFPGYDIIMGQINDTSTITKRRVGLISSVGPPPRKGSEILDKDNNEIGVVTSGCFSPHISINICMGYVKTEFIKSKTEIQFKIRNKIYPGFVKKLPFIATKYCSAS